MVRSTYTLATLEVSDAAYEEIAGKLKAAGYDAERDGVIDMNGIGVCKAERPENSKASGMRASLTSGRRVAMLADPATTARKAPRKASLAKVTGTRGYALSVDSEAGIIRGVAVMKDSDTGYGFFIDKTSREQAMALINADPNGVKMHYKHPDVTRDDEGNVTQVEDQLGAFVGRLKNARMDGDTLRADVYLGEQAKKLPGLGDVWSYLMTVAEKDPTAIGLSAVFAWDPEVILDDQGQAEMIAARITSMFQVDFVGQGAATPNGLLSLVPGTVLAETKTPLSKLRVATLATPAEAVTASGSVAAMARTAIDTLRALLDASVNSTATAESQSALIAAITSAGNAAQAVTVAARTCIDFCNAVPPGSMVDQVAGDSATACRKLLDLLVDQICDALELIQWRTWGTDDLSRACAAATPLLRTCRSTIEDCEDALSPITYSTATLTANANAIHDRGLSRPAVAMSVKAGAIMLRRKVNTKNQPSPFKTKP